MTLFRVTLVLAVIALAVPVVADAAVVNENLTINATVASRAKFTISPTTINFADADPDVVPSIAADSPVAVSVKIRATAVGASTLDAISTDLIDGGSTISIGNVDWTSTGDPEFAGGTLATASQTIGNFTGSGNFNSTFDFTLANSWAYEVGNYTGTVSYTLTTP